MNKGSEALQLLKSLLKPTALILLWMTCLRLLLYAAVFYSKIEVSQSQVLAAFWAGFRFDLCVVGFFWLPIVVFTWLLVWIVPTRKLFFVWKLYFVVLILVSFDFAWLDFFWSAITSGRINHEFFTADSRQLLDEGWKVLGATKSWIATLGMGFSSLGLVLFIYDLKILKDYSLPPVWKVTLQAVISVFLVAFAARGTWTAHHLNVEHTQISENHFLNQLPLNPLWNLDK